MISLPSSNDIMMIIIYLDPYIAAPDTLVWLTLHLVDYQLISLPLSQVKANWIALLPTPQKASTIKSHLHLKAKWKAIFSGVALNQPSVKEWRDTALLIITSKCDTLSGMCVTPYQVCVLLCVCCAVCMLCCVCAVLCMCCAVCVLCVCCVCAVCAMCALCVHVCECRLCACCVCVVVLV